ncbi:MAG: 30S ribosomal protein S2 [Brevinema sp.]
MASIIYNDTELMRNLLEAGVHFGHPTKRWNPKMKPFIFTKRNGIYIVDLRYTTEKLKEAYAELKAIAEKGGQVLFVGTKKQAQQAIKEEGLRCGMFYVSKRWLGGTLTNFPTLKKSIDKMKRYESKLEKQGDTMIKKERTMLQKEVDRMRSFYDGIRDMKKVPAAIWVVDVKREINAVLEARKLGIKVFGIADTNIDPDMLDFLVPGNDDAIRSVALLTQLMSDAVIEGAGFHAKAEGTSVEEEVLEEAPTVVNPTTLDDSVDELAESYGKDIEE